MGLWGWVRARPWGWQLLIFGVGIPVLAAALYVAGRSMQYLAAEGDAGAFVPGTAQGLLRLRDLERHLGRLEDSLAWRTVNRKILKSPAIRPGLNGFLQDAGLPTLDDLEDVRKATLYSRENLVRAAGRDFAFAVRFGHDWKAGRFCAVTRLRWSDYLLAPLAGFVLARDGDALKLPGRAPLWVAFEGALAIASNDAALLADARRGKGRAPAGARPLEAALRLEDSAALDSLRETLRRSGLLPFVKSESVRGLTVSADVDGGVVLADALLEGAEPVSAGARPPAGADAWAPPAAAGVYATAASFADVQAWLRTLGLSAANVELERWDKFGFSSALLPRLDPGMAIVTGAQDDGTSLYPAFALFVPSTDPAGAVEALTELVRGAGGLTGQKWTETWSAGAAVGKYVKLKVLGDFSNFLEPCWAAVPGGLLFGNNLSFTQACAAAASEKTGGGLGERRSWKRVTARLKSLGFPAESDLLRVVVLPPAIRESLDGFLKVLARQLIYNAVPDATIRAEVEGEFRAGGQALPPETEMIALVNERREAKIRDREARLRADLGVMDAARWAAASGAKAGGGIALRFALGFEALSDR